MMRAVYIEQHGGPEVLRFGEVPTPDPGPGEVRIRTVTAALNHLDLWVRRGIPGIRLDMPHVLGADGAGTVDTVGSGVESVAPGDRVIVQPGLFCGRCEFCMAGEESLCIRYRLLGEHVPGTFAEYAIAPAENVYPKPDALSWASAAAFPLAYQTAWRLVMTAGALETGDTVLIHGIGGGVASAALQIAKHTGADVTVTSSSDEKLSRARELGADATINYTNEDIVAVVRDRTRKRGVDLVIDNVGQATWTTSIECVRKGGRIATCGATTGSDATTPINRVYWKQLSIHGSTMASRAEFETIAAIVGDGAIEPIIDREFPLERACEAFHHLEDGDQFGKVVLRIREN